jgi:hypothetical protein
MTCVDLFGARSRRLYVATVRLLQWYCVENEESCEREV